MPGILEHRCHDSFHQIYDHAPGITRLPSPSKLPSSASDADIVKYIPSQMDPLAGTSTRALRQSPLWLFVQDAGVLATMLPYLPNVFLPFKTQDKSAELYPNKDGIRDTIVQVWLFIMETVLLILALPAIVILPGSVLIAAYALCFFTVYLITWPMEGPRITYSSMNDSTLVLAEQHKDERWLFVNGCATGHSGLQKNVDRIAETFGRAVIGIHNKTYGLPADILECLIQRCFSYKTSDVRVAYAYVKATLIDPTVNKVVLIGHSQGGIIISLVLDQLFAELPHSCMSKLEVYTFGSAASHFSNPLTVLPSRADTSASSRINPLSASSQAKHVIAHIEHYANEKDMVPRWGVLHCVQDVLNNRYAGSVYVRLGASGHLFNQHYMDPMFPLPEKHSHSVENSFLEKVVNVDTKLAIKREIVALGDKACSRQKSGLEFGTGQIVSDGSGVTDENSVMTFARTDSGTLMAEEAQGKTVKELSRLWRYQGGRSPRDTTVPENSLV